MNLTFKGGQRQAVITKVCVAGREFRPNATDEETLKGVLDGDLEIVIRQAEKAPFDRKGRRIPPRGLVAAVCDQNRNFYLNQPKLDYVASLAHFNGTGMEVAISPAEFEARSSVLLAAVGVNEPTKNLLKGVRLPIVIPQIAISDLGEATEKFAEAAGVSYRRQFPNRPFTNYRAGELAGQVQVVAGSRYERLIQQLASGSIVGIYFPNSLQGFSVLAQQEQMATLPEGFILSGPLDAAMGWLMYPDVVARDFHTPGYDCSAVSWRSLGNSLYFEAIDDMAYFLGRVNLGDAYDYYSGGLLFLG